MTECTQLSDRMAAVVHGPAEWSSQEATHLAGCPDCAAEWRVMRAGALIGSGVAQTLPADFLATRIVAAAKAGGRASPWRARLRWLALPAAAAAVAVLMVMPGRTPRERTGSDAAVAEIQVLPELEGLDASALESVLELLPASDRPLEIRGFEELSDDEVTRLLNSLEG
jgi:hypothetical protein